MKKVKIKIIGEVDSKTGKITFYAKNKIKKTKQPNTQKNRG